MNENDKPKDVVVEAGVAETVAVAKTPMATPDTTVTECACTCGAECKSEAMASTASVETPVVPPAPINANAQAEVVAPAPPRQPSAMEVALKNDALGVAKLFSRNPFASVSTAMHPLSSGILMGVLAIITGFLNWLVWSGVHHTIVTRRVQEIVDLRGVAPLQGLGFLQKFGELFAPKEMLEAKLEIEATMRSNLRYSSVGILSIIAGIGIIVSLFLIAYLFILFYCKMNKPLQVLSLVGAVVLPTVLIQLVAIILSVISTALAVMAMMIAVAVCLMYWLRGLRQLAAECGKPLTDWANLIAIAIIVWNIAIPFGAMLALVARL